MCVCVCVCVLFARENEIEVESKSARVKVTTDQRAEVLEKADALRRAKDFNTVGTRIHCEAASSLL